MKDEINKRPFVERFVADRYTYLFLSVLLLIIVEPYFRADSALIPFLFLFLMLAVVWTLELRKWFFRLLVLLAAVAFVMSYIKRYSILAGSEWMVGEFILQGSYLIFLFLTILTFIFKLFTEKQVTGKTIQGGIAVYFLMGIFWVFCYNIVLLLDPNAISLEGGTGSLSDLMYFSFTTLTTLGYGDYVPVSYFAKNLTMLEATLGQIFLVVFIARLVGLYISQKRQ